LQKLQTKDNNNTHNLAAVHRYVTIHVFIVKVCGIIGTCNICR